jgi:hypothetical protein
MVVFCCETCKSELTIDEKDFDRSELKNLLIRDGILSSSENSNGLIIKFKNGCPLCGFMPEGEIEVSRVKSVQKGE